MLSRSGRWYLYGGFLLIFALSYDSLALIFIDLTISVKAFVYRLTFMCLAKDEILQVVVLRITILTTQCLFLGTFS